MKVAPNTPNFCHLLIFSVSSPNSSGISIQIAMPIKPSARIHNKISGHADAVNVDAVALASGSTGGPCVLKPNQGQFVTVSTVEGLAVIDSASSGSVVANGDLRR